MIRIMKLILVTSCIFSQVNRTDLDLALLELSKINEIKRESIFKPVSFDDSKPSPSHALNSLILPGWGQLKNGSNTSAWIFIGIEIAAWTLYATYNSKGNQGREDVNGYADNKQFGFNRLRYYHKIYKRSGLSGVDENAVFQTDQNYGIDDGSAYNSLKASSIWSDLRKAESDFGDGTHTLPETKTQQYYELVGKYSMFIAGWGYIDDSNYIGPMPTDNYREFGNGLTYGWPESGRSNRPKFILDYNDIRDQMNSYFGTSKWMLRTVFINHVMSAIEALIVSKKANKKLNLEYSTSFYRGVANERLTLNYRF